MTTAAALETIDHLLERDDDETTAGNYFVANYPPFHFWDANTALHVGELIQRPSPKETPLGVYFHIPFCRKRCHFCYFRVYTEKNAQEIASYLDAGMRELEIYARAPFINERKPSFVYFGGGTPSYLSVKQLQMLTDRMKELLPWDEAEEVAFEAEPGTLTEAKLTALREIGITRLSLGIENFDAHILEINGRAHRTDEIYRAYKFAQSVGFPQINIDLIAGMVEETDENWRENVRKTVELAPDSVTIYQMEVPYNTGIFKQMKEEGKLNAPVATWKHKRQWVDLAFSELEQAGYTVTSGYTAVRDPEKTKFLYRDKLWQGADLVGCGCGVLLAHRRRAFSEHHGHRRVYRDGGPRGAADVASDGDHAGRADDPGVDSAIQAGAGEPELLSDKIRGGSDGAVSSADRRYETARTGGRGRRLDCADAGRAAESGHPAARLLFAAAPELTLYMSPVATDAELLYPLSLFRQAEGAPLPAFEVIDGEAMPQPYRDLLVHGGDMTSRLAAFHEGRIVLEVLHREVTPEAYRREVVLHVEASGMPVEYGAIEIFLEAFPERLRPLIVEARLPLGGLLNAHHVTYRSQPKAFIKLAEDAMMSRIFGMKEAAGFYGRCNELVREDGELLARIVEVLRP